MHKEALEYQHACHEASRRQCRGKWYFREMLWLVQWSASTDYANKKYLATFPYVHATRKRTWLHNSCVLKFMINTIRTTPLFSPWENPELSCHERKSIAMDTRDQSSQPVWHVARTKRITVPKCGKILCQKSKTVSLPRQCAYPKPLLHPSAPIARGHQHESLSLRSTSASRTNLEVLHQLTNVALLYIPQKVGFMHHRMTKYKVRSVLSQTVHWKLSPLIVNIIKHQ